MSEEIKKVQHQPFSAEAISDFLAKNGISTLLLLVFVYFAYTGFLQPASEKYMKLLDSVAESNTSLTATIDDLRQGLRDVGERNTELAIENATHLSSIDRKLADIEELSKDIDRKLDLMRQPRYMSTSQTPTPKSSSE